MKKIILGVVCLIMLFGFSACGGAQSSQGESAGDGDEQSAVNYEVGEGSAVTWTDSIGSKWVQLVVPVTNTGEENLYLGSATFDLEDESGSLVKTLDMVSVFPEVIKPGETACYYEETDADFDSDQPLKVIPHVDVQKATVDCIRLDVSETNIQNEEYGGIKVTGRVENTTDKEQDMVYVTAILYDSNNNVIGSVYTILENKLAAGEKIGFEASTLSAPDSLNADAVDHFDVFAYPSQMQF